MTAACARCGTTTAGLSDWRSVWYASRNEIAEATFYRHQLLSEPHKDWSDDARAESAFLRADAVNSTLLCGHCEQELSRRRSWLNILLVVAIAVFGVFFVGGLVITAEETAEGFQAVAMFAMLALLFVMIFKLGTLEEKDGGARRIWRFVFQHAGAPPPEVQAAEGKKRICSLVRWEAMTEHVMEQNVPENSKCSSCNSTEDVETETICYFSSYKQTYSNAEVTRRLLRARVGYALCSACRRARSADLRAHRLHAFFWSAAVTAVFAMGIVASLVATGTYMGTADGETQFLFSVYGVLAAGTALVMLGIAFLKKPRMKDLRDYRHDGALGKGLQVETREVWNSF